MWLFFLCFWHEDPHDDDNKRGKRGEDGEQYLMGRLGEKRKTGEHLRVICIT